MTPMTPNKFCAALALCLVAGAVGALPAAPPANQRAQTVLDEVWQQVAKRHYDADFDRKYRKSLYDAHRAGILASRSDAELAEKLNAMLHRIGDSHITVMPPPGAASRAALAAAQNPVGQATAGTIRDVPCDAGFSILDVGGKILVHQVHPDSEAAKAGVRPGDEIRAVNGVAIRPEQPIYPPWSFLVRALLSHGGAHSPFTLELTSPDGKSRQLALHRRANGGAFLELGAMPRMAAAYRSEWLPDQTAYIRFDLFSPEMVKRLRRDIRKKFTGARGVILDLRGNPGGILATAEWVAAWLSPKPVSLGKLIIDGIELQFTSMPQPGTFTGPVVVLVDRDSCSTSELLSAAMQDARAATVVGTRTPGWCLPSQFIDLPSGFRLQTVFGDSIRANGKRIEKVGVTPDFTVEPTRDGLAAGHDAPLEKAQQLIRSRRP